MHEDNTNAYGTADAIYLWERGNETFSYETYCQYYTLDSNWSNRCQTENYCESNPNDEICTATRSKSWVGEVGLMYPSDEYLVYANGVDNNCYNDPSQCVSWGSPAGDPTLGWIYNSNNLEGHNSPTYNWFVSPSSSSSDNVFDAYSGGNLLNDWLAYSFYGVRPVLYLSSNVKITDGTGEQNNPYKLGL